MKKMKKKYILIPVGILVLAGISVGTVLANDRVALINDKVTVEAGSELNFQIQDYIDASESKTKKIVVDTSNVDTSKIGTYPISITYKKQALTVTANVNDTVAPVISTQENVLNVKAGETVSLEQLGISTEDVTNVTLKFEDEASETVFDTFGETTKTVTATDEAGNESSLELKFMVTDANDPVIKGVEEKTLFLEYDNNLMDGISASDVEDGDLTDKIKVSDVDLLTEGEKEITYSVEDNSGNITEETVKIIIESCIEEVEKTMYANAVADVFEKLENTNAEKLGSLTYAQEVKVTGQDKATGWYRISYGDGVVAFVSNSYLSDTKPVAKPKQTAPVASTSTETQTTEESVPTDAFTLDTPTESTPATTPATSGAAHYNAGDVLPDGTIIEAFLGYSYSGKPRYAVDKSNVPVQSHGIKWGE